MLDASISDGYLVRSFNLTLVSPIYLPEMTLLNICLFASVQVYMKIFTLWIYSNTYMSRSTVQEW